MILRVLLILLATAIYISPAYAGQSTITIGEGYACMGEDKSRKQTEKAANDDAKRKAAEFVLTAIKSETEVKNFELEKDLLSAYTNATVKVLQELEKGWYKDASLGDCYKAKIKVEVVPDEREMEKLTKTKQAADDPSAPLNVRVWTDRNEYKNGERIKVYIKGNKPFYARVLYKDAAGSLLQLLPNPYRTDNYFNGGVVYELPAGNDRFDLEVIPPYGEESLVVYSSTSPLGDIKLQAEGGVYKVNTKSKDIGVKTRGIEFVEKETGKTSYAAEFFEERTVVTTKK